MSCEWIRTHSGLDRQKSQFGLLGPGLRSILRAPPLELVKERAQERKKREERKGDEEREEREERQASKDNRKEDGAHEAFGLCFTAPLPALSSLEHFLRAPPRIYTCI